MKYGPLKTLNHEVAIPQIGFFSVELPISWQKCRETFAERFNCNTIGFYFCHGDTDNSDAVYSFILKTEDILRVSGIELISTRMSKTNRIYATWIEPSEFWKESEQKRSLFTILLRCGTAYDGDYEKALFHEFSKNKAYVQDTMPAVKRFLFGFTNFKKDNYQKGWRNIFINKSKDDVKTILKSHKEKNFFGVGTLWS